MTFLYPIGLLGLIGIPVLIIVYILKNRYTEQTIAATYIWRLSERFLKRRNPLARITGIISLILQLLLVAVLSFAVAHPIITLRGAADEYTFVLDGSASMSMERDGVSRLDSAKGEIEKIIDAAESGSVFSLVYVTGMTETVFELEDDRALIKERLASLECSGGSIDYTDSIGVAQRLFNENPSVLTYLLTDTDHTEHTNVNVINVARDEVNASVYDIEYTALDATTYTVMGKAACHGGNMMTDIEVRNDREDRILGSLKLQLIDGVETDFSITFESERFYSLTVTSSAEDAMAADDSAVVYDLKSENEYSALLVSDTPFLLESALGAVSNAKITVMSTKDYKTQETDLASADKVMSGYGLYIYDSYSPVSLPKDGTVWFVGPTSNITGAGFSVQGTVELDDGVEIELNKSSGSFIKKLTAGLVGDGIYMKKFTKCGVYGNFSSVYTYMGNPVVFTGETDGGSREVVFAFNLHDTNFTLSSDYPILLHNLLKYSFPDVMETTEYYCGDTAEVNVIPGCTGIRVTPPSGNAFYADMSKAVSEFLLSESGEYKITLESSGTEREFYIYSSVPTEERDPISPSAAEYSIRGEASDEGRDGKYDPMTLLLVLAVIFFTAEWMVYCYEKYQLR